jgi:hypothetical protein
MTTYPSFRVVFFQGTHSPQASAVSGEPGKLLACFCATLMIRRIWNGEKTWEGDRGIGALVMAEEAKSIPSRLLAPLNRHGEVKTGRSGAGFEPDATFTTY